MTSCALCCHLCHQRCCPQTKPKSFLHVTASSEQQVLVLLELLSL